MILKFTCPNGHPISCAEDRIGKAAKCPKCGAQFVVPGDEAAGDSGSRAADQVAQPTPTESSRDSAKGRPEGSGKQPAGTDDAKTEIMSAEARAQDIIVFFCPNNHKLNAPSRLQGKPGQCPHCGVKFHIPTYEDVDEQDEDREAFTDEEIPVGTLVEDDDLEIEELEEIGEFPDEEEVEIDVQEDLEHISFADEPVPPPRPMLAVEDGHPLAGVFMRLWDQKGEGGIVELYLSDGELLSPEFFSAELSQLNHGVFAVRSEDGTYTVTTVPWDSISKAVLKRVEKLPMGLFE